MTPSFITKIWFEHTVGEGLYHNESSCDMWSAIDIDLAVCNYCALTWWFYWPSALWINEFIINLSHNWSLLNSVNKSSLRVSFHIFCVTSQSCLTKNERTKSAKCGQESTWTNGSFTRGMLQFPQLLWNYACLIVAGRKLYLPIPILGTVLVHMNVICTLSACIYMNDSDCGFFTAWKLSPPQNNVLC